MNRQEALSKLVNDETLTFSPICEMMMHSQVNNGKRFLCMMNNVTDYCTSQNEGNSGINYHIVYLPCCPDWGRELLVRFLIHKYALTTDAGVMDIAREKSNGEIVLPIGVSGKSKEGKRILGERAYYKKLVKTFADKINPDSIRQHSLFVVQDKDIISRGQDKNPWLEELYTKDSIIDAKTNVLLTTSKTAFDLENEVKKHRNQSISIDNIFIFHSQNRGRITASYCKNQLERLNKYGLGIKNCVVFYLTERPFRLYYALENIKQNLVSTLLNIETKQYDDFAGFVTFTQEESNYIFGKVNQISKYIIDSDERDIFTSNVDSYFDNLPHNYKFKDLLLASYDNNAQQHLLETNIEGIGTIPPNILSPFFNYYSQLWNDEINLKIESFIKYDNTVAFVMHQWTDEKFKKIIKRSFYKEGRSILIKDFDDLKKGIQADTVVLFSYRYTDIKYKSYPNSFDPLPLKNGQKGIVIINRLTHNNYYEWNSHYYDKDYNGLLFSDLRRDLLGWSKRSYQRPILPEIWSNIDEAEIDARDYQAERCTVFLEASRPMKVLSCSRAVFVKNDIYCFAQLKDLPEDDDLKIQLVDEIVKQIKDIFVSKTDCILKSEEYIRKDAVYGLSQEEIESPIELWKYLLKRKIDELGTERVYNEVFPTNKEISQNGFARWTDFNYPMILPRSRRSQNNLLTYLGFTLGSPYHRVILAKKLRKNSETRTVNGQIESLLQSILPIEVIQERDFQELSEVHSDILTVLEINTADELNAFKDLLEINLKKVKKIQYD